MKGELDILGWFWVMGVVDASNESVVKGPMNLMTVGSFYSDLPLLATVTTLADTAFCQQLMKSKECCRPILYIFIYIK